MSISQSMSFALSGLSASSRAAQTVSMNVANANTPGYGVRVADSISVNGRVTTVVSRYSDPGLVEDRRLAESDEGYHRARADSLQRMEEIIGVPGTIGSLADRIGALESSFSLAASSPQSDVRLEAITSALGDVANHLNTSTNRVQSLRMEADASIATQVDRLNSSLEQLQKLNSDMIRLTGTGRDTSNVEDQRQILVDEISQMVPVRQLQRQSGQIALLTPTGAALLDGEPARIEFSNTPLITADLSYGAGTLGGIVLNGQPIDMSDQGGRLFGGTLAGAFAVRDELGEEVQGSLDAIAEDLVARFQGTSVDPTQTATDPGLLTDAGGAFTAPDSVGLAGRISVNTAILPAEGGELRLIRDGLGSVLPGPTADGTQLNAWRDALVTPRAQADGSLQSADVLAGAVGSFIGVSRTTSETSLAYATGRADSLRAEELRGGVDTDAEMQRLLVIEQAFSANARVIETASDMLRRIMEL